MALVEIYLLLYSTLHPNITHIDEKINLQAYKEALQMKVEFIKLKKNMTYTKPNRTLHPLRNKFNFHGSQIINFTKKSIFLPGR